VSVLPLSAYLCFCPSVCLLYLSVILSARLSFYLSACLYVSRMFSVSRIQFCIFNISCERFNSLWLIILFVCPYASLFSVSVCLYMCQSIFTVYLSFVFLFYCLSVFLSACLTVCQANIPCFKNYVFDLQYFLGKF
jgi:hypothetical protein